MTIELLDGNLYKVLSIFSVRRRKGDDKEAIASYCGDYLQVWVLLNTDITLEIL